MVSAGRLDLELCCNEVRFDASATLPFTAEPRAGGSDQ